MGSINATLGASIILADSHTVGTYPRSARVREGGPDWQFGAVVFEFSPFFRHNLVGVDPNEFRIRSEFQPDFWLGIPSNFLRLFVCISFSSQFNSFFHQNSGQRF